MNNEGEKITYFAETDYRNNNVKFGIKAKDRAKHMYVIGKTGMGKSTLLENMAVQDIQHGNGFAFIDPHGKSADLLLDYIPEERIKDVLYFAPFDLEYPVSFNVMEDVGSDRRHLVASGLMSAFKKIWQDAWSARMEYILNNTLLALLEYPDSTILGVNRMLADKTYRKRVVANISDVSVKSFWEDEFEKYSERFMTEAGAAIQNKVGQFISNPLIRNIIGQPRSTFDIRKIMDEKKILIIDLSKGRVGEDNANLIGSMLITKIYLAAMSRADVDQIEMARLPNFYLYVDEFQSFANESFADILSEARKYKLNLTIAHQYIEQMSDEVRAAVFGNVGSMITFRVGSYDATIFEKEFAPEFTAEDLVNLGFIQIYLKLMIDGVASRPFSARTLGPIKLPEVSYKKEIIEYSRSTYGKPRDEVADIILRWHESMAGLLDDPHVDAMRRKKAEEEEARKNGTYVKDDGKSSRKEEDKGSHNNTRDNRGDKGGRDRNKNRGNNRNDGRNDKRDDTRGDRRNTTPSGNTSQSQKSTPSMRDQKEQELREVMSLRQLEQKNDQKKKDQKKSQGNASDLRSALASVIKDAQRGVEEKVKEVENKMKDLNKESNASTQSKPSKENDTADSSEEVHFKQVTKIDTLKTHGHTETPKTEKKIFEIPKPELEKMLEVEEDKKQK